MKKLIFVLIIVLSVGICYAIKTLTAKHKDYLNSGIAHVNLGKYQKAIDDYTKAIELNPKYAEAYNNRGVAYGLQNLPTCACDDSYQAGLLYLKGNDRTNALKCVDLMKKVDSSSPLIKKLMDKIYTEPKNKN